MPKANIEKMPLVFKALSEPIRLKILLMLEGRPRTVSEVVDFFDLSQPTITRHLQTLTAGGLVRRRKVSQKVFYEVNPDSVSELCIQLSACFPCACVTVTSEIGDSCCSSSPRMTRKRKIKKK